MDKVNSLMNDRDSSALQVCTRCVMDTTDSEITFDENGVCDHCLSFEFDLKPNWDTGEKGEAELDKIVEQIRRSGQGRDFDCIIGLSGGLDSSFMLHKVVVDFGLRPLVFHVDGGWNSESAVHNIEHLVDGLGLDLFTEVINWEEMKDLQLAFFKSGVPHLDIPQDQAFLATLYKFANKHGVKYILNGGNYSTECVRNPKEWIYFGSDMAQVRDIHRQFGQMELKTFPFTNILHHKIYLRYIKGITMVRPLNNFPYFKSDAIKLLQDTYDWKPYTQKHFESRFTKFYEGYWLPERFGFDTRKVQFSSLILTGQMSRSDALEKLSKPSFDTETINHDIEYIATKLNISVEELMSYFNLPLKSFRDYKNQKWMFEIGSAAMKWLGLERTLKR